VTYKSVGSTQDGREKSGNKSGGATYATYKLEHFKSGLFGFTGDLFCTFCTLSHPTYENQTGPIYHQPNMMQKTVLVQVLSITIRITESEK
jgi:hypothetical protein